MDFHLCSKNSIPEHRLQAVLHLLAFEHWPARNHVVAINKLLGYTNRVAMTNRETHDPTPASNAQLCAFFEHCLKPTPPTHLD